MAAGSRPFTSILRVEAHNEQYTNSVGVYNISMTTSVQQLESIFMRYGPCRINLRHPSIYEDQHAFVNYTSLKDALTAARAMNGAILDGHILSVQVKEHSYSPRNDSIVKVENLSRSTSEETLNEVFGFNKDVDILGITIKSPAIGPNYAYIYYYNEQDAQKAVSELDNTKIDESVVRVKLYSLKKKLKVDCEPLVVQIIMSPDRPEYRSQFQSIERVDLVVIQPLKKEQGGPGFKIKGNKERLEEVQSHVQLIISKLEERLGDERFTLPSKCIRLLADDGTRRQISKIEHKHGVEFLAHDISSQELLDMPTFCQRLFQNPRCKKKGHQAKSCTYAESSMASKYEEVKIVNFQVHGLKQNLKLAVADLKAALHIVVIA